MTKLVWILTAFICLSFPAMRARAESLAKPKSAEARAYLSAGNKLYNVRSWLEATEQYKAGALLEPAPIFYYNLGQCYRQLGRHDDAIWHYERFLNLVESTAGDYQAIAKDFIAQMKAELEKKAMTQPPVEPASTPQPIAPALMSVSSSSAVQSPTASVEARRGMPSRRKLAIAVAAAGVAAVAVGIGFGLHAETLKDDANAICPMKSCERANEGNELFERGKTNARYANVTFGVGGAALVGAAVLWITGSPREPKNAAIAPQVSRSFAGVTAFTRF